jgi:hypothetical protein
VTTFVPKPGIGDFVNEWETAEEAVADLLDFFFSTPARTDHKRRFPRLLRLRGRRRSRWCCTTAVSFASESGSSS